MMLEQSLSHPSFRMLPEEDNYIHEICHFSKIFWARGGEVIPHYESVIMLIAWRVSTPAFEGRILILHYIFL